jgi:uncharacterized membrane protein
MLAAVYPAWLLASIRIVPFSGLVATVIVIAAAALGWSLAIRRRHADRAWLRSLVLVELVSLLLFAAYLWLRGYTPQILGTEKPMDIAFLASSTRAMTIPPPDPWFAGEPINYYYLGYLLHGTVARLSGVAPETGFNLALATIFSTTAVERGAALVGTSSRGSGRARRHLRGRNLGESLRALEDASRPDEHRLSMVVGQRRRHRLALQPHRLRRCPCQQPMRAPVYRDDQRVPVF